MADAPKNQKAGFEIWIDFFEEQSKTECGNSLTL